MKSIFKTTLFLSILTGLFLGAGYFIGGRSGAIIALFMAILFNFGTFWFSSSLVLKMQRAKPLDTRKYRYIEDMVKSLATKSNLPMPKLYFVDSPIPNAFATGRSYKHGVVAVTRGITEILNKAELESVLAHELGHIKNRDMLVSTIAATIAGAIAMLAELAFWGSALFGGSNNEDGENNSLLGSLAMLILAPLAAMMIQMAVSRTREFGADAYGAKIIGHGKDLASALEKLESFKPRMSRYKPNPNEQATAHLMFTNMFNFGGLSQLFSTHPTTKARVSKLNNY